MSAANRRVLVDFKQFAAEGTELGFPDGMTVDAGGRVWVACYDAHQVAVFEPERPDVVVERIEFPTAQITSLAFGGEHYSELFVTSARQGLNEEQLQAEPLAGATFRVTGLSGNARGFAPDYMF